MVNHQQNLFLQVRHQGNSVSPEEVMSQLQGCQNPQGYMSPCCAVEEGLDSDWGVGNGMADQVKHVGWGEGVEDSYYENLLHRDGT